METCIRFKDMSEEEDTDQNQEYEDDELGPVYPENSKPKKDETTLATLEPPPDDFDTKKDDNAPPGRVLPSDGNNNKTAYNDSTNTDNRKQRKRLRYRSNIQTDGHKNETAGTTKTTTASSKTTKQIQKEKSSNVIRVVKKPISEKKGKKLRLNDKKNKNVKDKATKNAVNNTAVQNPSK